MQLACVCLSTGELTIWGEIFVTGGFYKAFKDFKQKIIMNMLAITPCASSSRYTISKTIKQLHVISYAHSIMPFFISPD